jgi:colicin import membrane protein
MTNFLRAMMIASFACVLLLVGGCKKSVEGEDKAYQANVAKLGELQAQYPGFKPALEARLASGKEIYDAAASLSDDAKIEKLSAANKALSGGFVSDLQGLDAKIKKLREKRVEAAAKAGDESSRAAAKLAADDADKTLTRVEKTLETGAKDDAGANAVLKKVVADIETAQSAIDKVLEVDKSKKDDAAAKDDAKAAADAKEKADAEAKVADWKCEFCGTMNKHDHGKCDSCGAARPAAPEAKADGK